MNPVCKLNGDLLMFHCPGCGCCHGPRVIGTVSPVWQWNNDLVKPTVSPSILVRGTVPITDEQHAILMKGGIIEPIPLVCHSFVRNGTIEFLDDCTHGLAGKTVPLPEWDS